MKEMKVGCGKPTGATVGGPKKEAATSEAINRGKEVSMAMIKIGTQAPDFEAPAFHNGKFIQVKLSDYLGKWVSLCFYPGDFTFV